MTAITPEDDALLEGLIAIHKKLNDEIKALTDEKTQKREEILAILAKYVDESTPIKIETPAGTVDVTYPEELDANKLSSDYPYTTAPSLYKVTIDKKAARSFAKTAHFDLSPYTTHGTKRVTIK